MQLRTSTSSTSQAPTKRLVIALRALALGVAVALVAAVALGSVPSGTTAARAAQVPVQAIPKRTATPKPTATPKSTPTPAPIIDYVPTDNGPNFFNDLFVNPGQAVKSNVVKMHSFNVPLPVTVLGDGSMRYRINGKGGWTAQPGTISAGDTLQLRLTAADAFGVTTSGQVRIGDAPFNWSIRTRDRFVFPVQRFPFSFGPLNFCPVPGDYIASLLSSADDLWADQEAMVSFGPRILPYAGEKEWEDYIFDRFSEIPGVVVSRQPVVVPGGWLDYFSPTAEWSLTLIEERDGQEPVETEVPVAGFRPYAGTGGSTSILTPPEGVVADLVTSTADAAGNILLGSPQPGYVPIIIPNPLSPGSYWHDPEGEFPGGTEYDNWPVITGTAHTLGFNAGALAAITVLGLSNDAAAGLWYPFGAAPSSTLNSVPTLYVGKESGELLYAKVAEAAADPDLTLKAHLTLYAEWHLPGSAMGFDDIVAILPGRDYEGPDNPGETVIFSTHTDGISATEENGAVALLAMAEYFAQLPQGCRDRTLVLPVLEGHFRGDVPEGGLFTARNPQLVANAVARVGIEHLGSMSWQDGRPELTGEEGYAPTGGPEPSGFQSSTNNRRLVSIFTDAVILEDLRSASSIRGGGGTGTPATRYISGPPYMFNWGVKLVDEETGGVTFTLNQEKVGKERMYAEFRTFVRVASQLDKIDLTTIPLD